MYIQLLEISWQKVAITHKEQEEISYGRVEPDGAACQTV